MQAVRSVRVIVVISGTRLCEFFTRCQTSNRIHFVVMQRSWPVKRQGCFQCFVRMAMTCDDSCSCTYIRCHRALQARQWQNALQTFYLMPSRFAEQDSWMKWVSQPHEGFAPAIPTEAHCIRNLEQLLALSVFFAHPLHLRIS